MDCQNCGAGLNQNDKFCHQCGQNIFESKRPFRLVISEFIGTVFGVDSRLWMTLKNIFVPARIVSEYMEGKRQRYLPPIRIFILSLILFLAVIFSTFDDTETFDGKEKYVRGHLEEQYDSIASNYEILTDSLCNQEFKEELFGNNKLDSTFNIDFFQTNLNEYKITNRDVYSLSGDSIISKYQISGIWDKFILKQYLKVTKHPKSVMKYGLINLFWALLIVILLVSLVMKILYLKQNRFLVEHFNFQLVMHGTAFLGMVLLVIINRIFDLPGISVFILNIMIGVFYLYSVKNYYKQGWGKTTLKSIITGISYFFALILVSLLVLVFSLAFF
ncbi:MAG: DUF3667 domain-containing protein [Saprospiraceae bacterium]